MPPQGPHPASDRLDGWKEIASYLKRSVRTVQRWETQLRLPVHRLNTGQSESVYAIPAELDAWLASPPGRRGAEEAGGNGVVGVEDRETAIAPERTGGRRRAWIAATVGACALAVIGVAWLAGAFRSGSGDAGRGGAGTRQIASLAVDGNVLLLLDGQGAELGRHSFPGTMKDLVDPERRARFTAITDLDGDGRQEVIVTRPVLRGPLATVLNADGSERLHWSPSRVACFGRAPAVGAVPVPYFLYMPESPDGTFYVVVHVQDEFASAAFHLDGHGRLLHEYWSNGYIESMAQERTASGLRTFVGGISNETSRASLAVFDGPPTGAAPARTEEFRCADCPGRGPSTYFEFPQSRLQRRLNCMAATTGVSTREIGTVVQVQHGDTCTYAARPEDTEFAYYHLAPDLTITKSGVGNLLPAVIARLIAEGRSGLTAEDRYRGEDDLFPVWRWTARTTAWDRIDGPTLPASSPASR